MKVGEIMTRDVEMVQPDDSLQIAAKKMKDRDIGFLPVGDGAELLGVLSDRDLVIRGLAEGMDVNVMLSRDLMTTPAIYCFEDQDASEAARIMAEHQIRRLVVLSRDNKAIVGIISLGDLARNRTTDLSAKVLKNVSAPDASESEKNV